MPLDLDPDVAAAVRRNGRLVSLAARSASRSTTTPSRSPSRSSSNSSSSRTWALTDAGGRADHHHHHHHLSRHAGVHRLGASQRERSRRRRCSHSHRGAFESTTTTMTGHDSARRPAAAFPAWGAPSSSLLSNSDAPGPGSRSGDGRGNGNGSNAHGNRKKGKPVVFAPILATDLRTGAAVPHRKTDKKAYALRGGSGGGRSDGADNDGDCDGDDGRAAAAAAHERRRAGKEERRRLRAAEIWKVDRAVASPSVTPNQQEGGMTLGRIWSFPSVRWAPETAGADDEDVVMGEAGDY